MVKAIFYKNEGLIFLAIIFLILAIVIPVSMYDRSIDYDYIIQHGVETEATINPSSYDSNVSVNDIRYYNVEYCFYDSDGNSHIGRTSTSYNNFEIKEIIENETIMIKYDPETYESVESSYDRSRDQGRKSSNVFLFAFGGIDLIMWIIIIVNAINNISLKKVYDKGLEYDAEVTSISTHSIENNNSKYKVHYKWTDELGNSYTGSSSYKYLHYQAVDLHNKVNIKIKALGKKSFILTIPSLGRNENDNDRVKSPIERRFEKYASKNNRCLRCGQNLKATDVNCPNCGELVTKDDKSN